MPKRRLGESLFSQLGDRSYPLNFLHHKGPKPNFLPDNQIIYVFPITHQYWCGDVLVGQTALNRMHVVQQIGENACVLGTAMMMALDFGATRLNAKDAICNFGNELDIQRFLQQHNIRVKILVASVDQIKNLLEHSSVALTVDDASIGKHSVILDYLDDKVAIIRDPYHAWQIVLSKEYFMQILSLRPNGKTKIVCHCQQK